jgi:hypothetical protein
MLSERLVAVGKAWLREIIYNANVLISVSDM